MKTIIVKLQGGLGNQMFQYAFFLALKHNYPNDKVLLDINATNWKTKSQHNGLELPTVFGIDISKDIATEKEANELGTRYSYAFFPKNWRRVLRLLLGKQRIPYKPYPKKETHITEKLFSNKLLNRIENSVYMDGTWGYQGYFEQVHQQVKKTYAHFMIPHTETYQVAIEKIKKENCPISMHIRRGDFIKLGLSICSTEYYKKAIDIFLKEENNPKFFIFSNDIDWCKQEFKGLNAYFIEGHTERFAPLDMALMSECKHNIIANSSFSWWGAFLNKNEDKRVTYPSIIGKKEYMPQRWIII